jgi:hypothetical protein
MNSKWWNRSFLLIEVSRKSGREMTPFQMEPCYLDTAQPNALKAETLDAILVSFPAESVETIDLNVTFDDGTSEQAHYERKAVEIQ